MTTRRTTPLHLTERAKNHPIDMVCTVWLPYLRAAIGSLVSKPSQVTSHVDTSRLAASTHPVVVSEGYPLVADHDAHQFRKTRTSMPKNPSIKSTSIPRVASTRRCSDGIELDLRLPDGLPYFNGHFDGFPILPGVAQLHFLIALARRYFPLGKRMPSIVQVKFRKPVPPGATLLALLRLDSPMEQPVIAFEMSCDGEQCCSGKIRFGHP